MQFGGTVKVLRKYNSRAPEIHSWSSYLLITWCCSIYVLFGALSMHYLLDKHIIDYFIDIRILFVLSFVIIIEALYSKEVRP